MRDRADCHFLSIAEASKLVHRQEVSPVEITRECLKRIEELNPKLNAFITVTADQAVEQATNAEAEIKNATWRGPLHGIPVRVKDFFDTAGVKTTGAFEHFRHRVPARDAEVVTRLKEAGAIIVGKMNMHELGMGTTSVVSCFGPVHNPWNIDYVAGGSSGGSAAAIAAGLCFATVDTDAIGSCRLPAACCGATGFKATFGLVSTQGILEGEPVDEETAATITLIGKKSGNPQAVSPDNTFFCNYYGLPAASVPCGFSHEGLPVGLQVVGPQWGEGAVLNVAHSYQHATTWHLQHPSLTGTGG